MPLTDSSGEPVSRPSPRSSTVQRVVAVVLPLILALAFLWLALRSIEWADVQETLKRTAVAKLAVVAVIGVATVALRSLRWHGMLRDGGDVKWRDALYATTIGQAANSVLPARIGDAARIFMVSSRSTVSVAYAVATLLAERVADLVALIVIASGLILASPVELGWLRGAAVPVVGLCVAVVAAIGVLPRYPSLPGRLSSALPLSPAARQRIARIGTESLRGLASLHRPRRFAAFAGLTVVIWSMDALATMVAASAMGIAIPPVAAFVLLTALGLGSALPSTPGYVGIYQFAAITALTPFGVTRSQALAYILVVQAVLLLLMALLAPLAFVGYRTAAAADTAARHRVTRRSP